METQQKYNTFLFTTNLKEEGLVLVSIQMKKSDKKNEKQIPVAITIIMNTTHYKSAVINKQKMKQTNEV